MSRCSVPTAQRKVYSGFGAASTAEDVLTGVDLSGKLAVVTGGCSGIGLATTRALAAAGAHVIVTALPNPMNTRQGIRSLQAFENVEIARLDLADLESVRIFARDFLASGRRIDIFIGSAGIMAVPLRRVGPGLELHFAINHLGHFAIVNRLWPGFNLGARIVVVASRGHHTSGIRWYDIQFELEYDKWIAYGQSKTANVLFAVHLDLLAKKYGVRAFSLHPGRVRTNLIRHLGKRELMEVGIVDENGNIAGEVKTVEQGAATQLWAATSPRLIGLGGVYCEDCDIAELAPDDGTRIGVCGYAVDPDQAARLWALSAELTGLDAFA